MHLSGEAFFGLFSSTFYAEIFKTDLFRALHSMDSKHPSNPANFGHLNFEITLLGSDTDSSASSSTPQDEERPSGSFITFQLYKHLNELLTTQPDDTIKEAIKNILLYLTWLNKLGLNLHSLQVPVPASLVDSIPLTSAPLDMEITANTSTHNHSSESEASYQSSHHFNDTDFLHQNDHNVHVSDDESGSWNTVSCDLEDPISRVFENYIDGNETAETSKVNISTSSTTIVDKPNTLRTRYLERNSKVYKTYRCKHQIINNKQRELLDDNLRFFNQRLLREFYQTYLPLFRQLKDQSILRNYRYNFKFDRTRRFGSFYFHIHFTFNDSIDYNTRRNIHNNFLPYFKKIKRMVQDLNSDLRYYAL